MGVLLFTVPPRVPIEIDDCFAFLDTQLPSRILTSRASLRHPYRKSDPPGYRFVGGRILVAPFLSFFDVWNGPSKKSTPPS